MQGTSFVLFMSLLYIFSYNYAHPSCFFSFNYFLNNFQEVKDLVSTLNVISNEKLQAEKAKDSGKSKGKKKRMLWLYCF